MYNWGGFKKYMYDSLSRQKDFEGPCALWLYELMYLGGLLRSAEIQLSLLQHLSERLSLQDWNGQKQLSVHVTEKRKLRTVYWWSSAEQQFAPVE